MSSQVSCHMLRDRQAQVHDAPHLPCSEARAAALDLLVAVALEARARAALRAAPDLSVRLLTAAAAALGAPADAGAAAALLGNLFMDAAMRGQVGSAARQFCWRNCTA